VTRLTIADLEIERPAEGLEIETADGSVYSLQDPGGVRLNVLINLESMPLIEQIKALVAGDKFEEFSAQPEVDGYFFQAVIKKYAAHYGIDSLGEGVASLPSLNGTARQSRRTSRSKARTLAHSGRNGGSG
jgi:hypothetical protein